MSTRGHFAQNVWELLAYTVRRFLISSEEPVLAKIELIVKLTS